MNLVRKLKISKLVNVSFTDIEKEIINFINSKLSDLIPFQYDAYPESIFYMSSDDLYILEQDNNNDRLWVRLDGFWKVLENKYSMVLDDIQVLLKYMIEQAFKHKINTPLHAFDGHSRTVEQAFKQKYPH